jgi:hypothetical protein
MQSLKQRERASADAALRAKVLQRREQGLSMLKKHDREWHDA